MPEPESERVVARILDQLRECKESRRAHSLRTAETAVTLADRFGVDRDKAYVAGLSHDICKCMPVERQRALAAYRSADGLSEALLHGPAAASWLERELGVNDGEVLDAVAYHTVGKVGMGELAMVVWIADKIEPGRPSGISYHADSTGSIGLGALMRSVAERNAEYLLTHGWDLHPETERLLDFLRERYPS